MATIDNSIVMQDRASNVIDRVIRRMQAFSASATNSTSKLASVSSAFTDSTMKSVAFGTIAGNVAATLVEKLSQLPGAIIEIGDTFLGTQARMSMFVKSGEEIPQMMDGIYFAAQRARTGYKDMQDSVSKIGVVAKDVFGSNSEIIKFTETLSKSFAMTGATPAMISGSMLQITQALGSGKLQGDEFRSIAEGAPLVLDALSKYMNVARGDLKQLGADGEITASILKNAVLSYSNVIEDKFMNMPIRFSQAWTMFTNKLMYVTTPAFTAFANIASSAMQIVNNNLVEIIALLGYIALVSIFNNVNAIWGLIRTTGIWLAQIATASVLWIATHLPIVIAAAAVMGLLALMVKVPEVAGFIVGSAYVIKDAFVNAFNSIMNTFKFLMNGVISGINLIRKHNKQAPLEFFQMEELRDPTTSFQIGREKGIQLAQEAKQTLDKLGQNITDLTSPTTPQTTTIDGGVLDKVKDGGNVKIYEEDLKLLKDIALQEFNIRYKQVTPTVQVSFGDVRETVDVDQVIKRVNDGILELYENDLGGVVS